MMTMTANPLTLKYKSDGTLVITATYLDAGGEWQPLTGATVSVTVTRLGEIVTQAGAATEIGGGVYEHDIAYDIAADPEDILTAEVTVTSAGGSKTYAEMRLKVTVDRD
jgi:hypothetical protein